MTDFNCETPFGVASFAGVEFEILPSDHSGGRRIQTHEYPFRDDHYNEDLGDKPLKWSVKGAFVGENWRDKFTEAKAKWRKGGYYPFFEPTQNETFDAVLIDWSFSLDSKKLNYVEFTLELVERGLEPYLSEGDGAELVTVGVTRYLDSVQTWWYPRFNIYRDIAKVFSAYDNVRGYLSNLARQFMGIGSFLGANSTIASAQPTRDQAANFNRMADVYESVASLADSGQAISFHRSATEVRITGTVEEEDQAHMSALIALGYYFEALADNATYAEMALFRERAASLKDAVSDPAITLAIDGLLANLGRSASPPCRETITGQYHALPLAYQLYGDVSRAPEIMGLSGGVSGAAMNEVTYECPA